MRGGAVVRDQLHIRSISPDDKTRFQVGRAKRAMTQGEYLCWLMEQAGD
jgi:hypothetical protein